MSRTHSKEGIKDCVWSLYPLKSPGPDGFPSIFYIIYWNIVKDKLANFVIEYFQCVRVQEMINKAFIVLIPKTDKDAILISSDQLVCASLLIKLWQRFWLTI